MMMRLAVIVALTATTNAFAPQQAASSAGTELAAMSRRDAFGLAFSAAVGAASIMPEAAEAVSNPALQTFKGRKRTKGSFIPGKGIREHESFEMLQAVSNPALQTFKGRKETKGSYVPGKGIRSHFDDAM